MHRRQRLMLLAPALLGSIVFSVVTPANAATGVRSESTVAICSVGSTVEINGTAQSPRDYWRGYRDGYRQGYRDGNYDCRRHSNSWRQGRDDYTKGWLRGYVDGFEKGCRRHVG